MAKRLLLFLLCVFLLSIMISPTILGSSVNAPATSDNSSYKSGELESNPKAPVPNMWLGIPNNANLPTNIYSKTSQLVSSTAQGSASWTELGPKPITNPANSPTYGVAPFSGRVTAIAVNSSNSQNIYLGAAQGGVWKTVDGGASWSPLTDSQQSLAIGALAISPDGRTLYAGTGEPNHSGDSYSGAGLLKTTDGGKTWTILGSNIFTGSATSKVLINSGNPSRILVSTTFGSCCKGLFRDYNQSAFGVYLSTDGGNSWSSTLVSHDYRVSFSDLVASPSNPNIVFVGAFDGSVWESVNGGSTWTKILYITAQNCVNNIGCRAAIATTAASSNSLFVAFSSNDGGLYGLYRYNVSSAAISTLNLPPNVPNTSSQCGSTLQCSYDFFFVADPSNSNTLYLGTTDLFKTVDGGLTWTDLGGYTSTPHPDQHAFAFLPGSPSTILIGNDGGIWKSTDRGVTWINLNNGLGITQFESITGSPSDILFGGTQDNGCVQYQGISSWSLIVGGDGGWSGFEKTNPNIMYCNYTHLGFRQSTDGGKTWQDAVAGINTNDDSEFYSPVSQDPSTPGTLYIGSVRVYKTTNFAQSWSDVSGILGTGLISALAVAPSSSSTVYLGDEGGNVKVSMNGGATWQGILSLTYPVSSLAVDPTNSNIVYAAFPGLGVYKISNQGGSWQSVPLNPPQVWVDVVRLAPSGKAIYIGTDKGVYYSTDGGGTWTLPGTGLPNVAVFDLTITASNQVIAATHGRGAWSVTLATFQTVSLTMSYSIVGGGTGFSPPILSYTYNGQSQTATLGSTPTSYSADSGSTWSVGNPLSGSSSTERWSTNQPATGTLTGSQTLNFVYYHQYLISVSFSLIGGGTPTPPTFSYTSFGTGTSASLVTQQQNLWADSGPFAATNPLVGSTSTERWYAPSVVNGSVVGPGTVTLTYYHQFFLTVSGGNQPSQWYNSGSTATLNPQGVYGRASGAGFRIASYTIDGGAIVAVPPTSGTLDVQVVMNAPHTLNFNSIAQYEVALDSGAKSSLNFITAPTISSDNYWYDAGSPVKVVLNGTWSRGSGSGNRLLSYMINGGAANSVTSSGAVTILSLSSMTAPQSITTTVAAQFQLKTPSGSVSSTTPPSITGDTGWYDQGSSVKVEYNYVWNLTANQSRLNAISYDVDAESKSALPRFGSGTFTVTATMDKPHTIDIFSVVQSHFTISGGFNTQLSTKSPTNDGFYDSGLTTTATTEYTWNLIAGKNRENLVSYTLDGQTTNVTRAESGTFTTPSILFDKGHTLSFNSLTQYFVTFGFTDNSGSTPVTPTNLQIDLNGKVENVSGFRTWLDKGTTFKIASVIWEHVDVKPSNLIVYTVDMPLNETIRGRIFDAKLSVTDLLGVPVTSASTQMTLANGTQIAKNTDSNGMVSLRLIPLGTFIGSVSYLGSTTQFSGDASQQPTTNAKVFLSYPDLGVIGGGIAAVVVLVVLKFIIRRPGAPVPNP